MVSVPTSLGEWIHSPWFDLGLVVWKGYRPRVRLVLAGGHASAWFSPFWRGPAPGAQRYQAMRTIDTPVMETIGRSILQYRHTIRQDLPFRLKRLHVWNVSGWTPSQTGSDPKLRLIKRLLRTGPVSLQETRWHKETPETLYHNIPGLQIAHTAGLPTERGGISGGAAVLIPPGWRLDRTEEIIPGRAVLARNAGSLLDNWINFNLFTSEQQGN